MVRRNWKGDVTCRFCSAHESVHHLFFTCSAARYTWGIVGVAIGAFTRPTFFLQYFDWIAKHAKVSSNIQIVGLAAICWAIWKLKNRACFEHRLIRSPAELICYACAFLKYWAGLQAEGDREMLIEGARMLQQEALRNHLVQASLDTKRILDKNGKDMSK